MRPAVAFLRFVSGERVGQTVALEQTATVLGRHPSCDIVLDFAEISRFHARIFENHGVYFIEDLRSRNGTIVNGVKITAATRLKGGDRVRLCQVEFVFHDGFDQDASSASSAAATPQPARLKEEGSHRTQDHGFETMRPTSVPTLRAPRGRRTDHSDRPPTDGASEAPGDARGATVPPDEARTGTPAQSAERAVLKLRTLTRFSRNLSGHLEFSDLFESLTRGLFELFPQAVQVVYLEPSPTRPEEFEVRWVANRNGRPRPPQISREVLRRVMHEGQALLSEDVAGDQRFDHTQSVQGMTARSVMCVPVIDQQDTVIGVLQLTTSLLEGRFTHDDLDVFSSVAAQFGLALQTLRLYQARLRERDLQRELEVATQVQLSFLPRRPPEVRGYRFADHYEPARGVSGDYFDFVPLRDEKLGIVVADVAGKGIPAALLMARICSAVRGFLHTCENAGEVLRQLNAELITSALGHRFVTCIVAVLDPVRHRVQLANAGHLPPLRRHSGNVEPVGGQQSGLPLGIVEDARYEITEHPVAPGDTWLLFTDGVTEAKSADRSIYGMSRLAEYVRKGADDVSELVEGLVRDVESFAAGSPPTDDICIVGFQRLRADSTQAGSDSDAPAK